MGQCSSAPREPADPSGLPAVGPTERTGPFLKLLVALPDRPQPKPEAVCSGEMAYRLKLRLCNGNPELPPAHTTRLVGPSGELDALASWARNGVTDGALVRLETAPGVRLVVILPGGRRLDVECWPGEPVGGLLRRALGASAPDGWEEWPWVYAGPEGGLRRLALDRLLGDVGEGGRLRRGRLLEGGGLGIWSREDLDGEWLVSHRSGAVDRVKVEHGRWERHGKKYRLHLTDPVCFEREDGTIQKAAEFDVETGLLTWLAFRNDTMINKCVNPHRVDTITWRKALPPPAYQEVAEPPEYAPN